MYSWKTSSQRLVFAYLHIYLYQISFTLSQILIARCILSHRRYELTFKHIAKLKESSSVLRVLLMCFFESVLEWHNSFFRTIRQEMNENLKVWEDKLLRKYKLNKFAFLKKAKKFVFRFDEQLILYRYFSRKTNLLHDAKIKDENIMIDYFWKNLNANLVLVIFMKENDDFLKNFDRRVRMNKTTTKKIYELFNKTRVWTYDDQESRKTRFSNQQKIKFQESKKLSISMKRIERLMKKLSTIAKFTIKEKTKIFKIIKISKTFLRSCRFC